MLKKMTTFLTYFITLFCLAFADAPPEPSKKLRFFNLDLHISVIQDLKNIFESMGHEVVNWSISGHTWVFGKSRDAVDIVNERTWWGLNQEMCDQFYERYKDFLDPFDAFIVTHTPSFSLLYEKFNKPIIIVNSTRYEQPFTLQPEKWTWLNDYLKNGIEEGKIFIVSNNKGDQQYLKYYTGIDTKHIPSLCLYTNAQYTGQKEGFMLTPLLDVIQRVLAPPDLIGNSSLQSPYSWRDLYDFKGFIHIPYQISTMSLFEIYSANMPMFLPSKQFLKELQFKIPEWFLSQLSFFSIYRSPCPDVPGDPNNLNDKDVIKFWIDSCDFYDEENMPYVQHFDSLIHLEQLLKSTDCQAVSQKMREHNIKRKERVFTQWKSILEDVIAQCEKNNFP